MWPGTSAVLIKHILCWSGLCCSCACALPWSVQIQQCPYGVALHQVRNPARLWCSHQHNQEVIYAFPEYMLQADTCGVLSMMQSCCGVQLIRPIPTGQSASCVPDGSRCPQQLYLLSTFDMLHGLIIIAASTSVCSPQSFCATPPLYKQEHPYRPVRLTAARSTQAAKYGILTNKEHKIPQPKEMAKEKCPPYTWTHYDSSMDIPRHPRLGERDVCFAKEQGTMHYCVESAHVESADS